ncbi:MAG: NAD(P)-binding domain-containing protein [Patescibacteria group bacterium]
MRVTIIGTGELGSAIAHAVRMGDHTLALWDATPAKPRTHATCEEALAMAELVFVCVPSGGLQSALEMIESCTPGKASVCIATKGIDKDQLPNEWASQILLKHCAWGVLGGACIAEEVRVGMPTMLIVGSDERRVANDVRTSLAGAGISVSWTTHSDIVARRNALKNVYAIGISAVRACAGWNAAGLASACAIHEMDIYAPARDDHALFSTSIADLIATAFSGDTGHARIGRALVDGEEVSPDSEGIRALLYMKASAQQAHVHLPFLQCIAAVYEGEKGPEALVSVVLQAHASR